MASFELGRKQRFFKFKKGWILKNLFGVLDWNFAANLPGFLLFNNG